jgi:hypothetical protein
MMDGLILALRAPLVRDDLLLGLASMSQRRPGVMCYLCLLRDLHDLYLVRGEMVILDY